MEHHGTELRILPDVSGHVESQTTKKNVVQIHKNISYCKERKS